MLKKTKKNKKNIFLIITALLLIFIIAFSCDVPVLSKNQNDKSEIKTDSDLQKAISNVNVNYVIKNDWGSGFVADVVIKNNSGSNINGWKLSFSFPGNQKIKESWSSNYSQSGKKVTITNAGYNKTIPKGGSVSFGFKASYSGSNKKPTNFSVDGNSSGSSSSSNSSSASSNLNIPGKIEAEKYTSMKGIKTEKCSEGTLNIGWMDTGDWVEYKVYVKKSSNYKINFRVANKSTGNFDFRVGGNKKFSVKVNSTGGWQKWKTISRTVYLSKGNRTIRLNATGGPWNLNYMVFQEIGSGTSSSSSSSSSTGSGTGIVKKYGQLQVKGSKLCDKNGKAVQLKGMSSFWINWNEGKKYANKKVIYRLVDDWGITVYRVAMGVEHSGGYNSNPNEMKSKVIEVVDACIAKGIYVIIDWHSHDTTSYKSKEIAFFKEMAKKYGDKPNVMYELWNEPTGQSWDSVIKPYCQDVANEIRKIDPDNIIIVGSSTWSQDVHKCAANPLNGKNIMYTLHFYAGTHTKWLRDRADDAMNKGIAIFVSEWGMSAADGGSNGQIYTAESQKWIDWMNNKKISWANWSICDKKEASAALHPGASTDGIWSNSELTASGKWVKSKM